MTTLFVDTSALAKRYLTEVGTTWMRGQVDPIVGNVVIVCDLTAVEFFALLARRLRENTITSGDALILQIALLADIQNQYLSVSLDQHVLTRARDLVSRYPLRPPDAIQLASALHVVNLLGESVTFICADGDLLAAALAEGLTVDNPNLHP